MKIKTIKAKSIITKSGLPDADFVINPYTGCGHGCAYCYARFMKRFTGHSESWGDFVDVKINASELVKREGKKMVGKKVVLGSVTDPYQPLEKELKITRGVLEKLIKFQPELDVLTKSDLVKRDIDILKQIKKCTVSISLSILEDSKRNKIENSVSAQNRFDALKSIHDAVIRTVLFISPIFPYLTDWKGMIEKTKDFVDEYWFENLNLYSSVKPGVLSFLKTINSDLVQRYEKIYSKTSDYWSREEAEINNYCGELGLKYKIYFHHNKK